jgi:MoaA/NifB/PqqE/SkfB family radical SAM enzyme
VNEELILDGTKIAWHKERVDAWLRGERIAPVTIDLALTQACNFRCNYCYATMQRQDEHFPINKKVMTDFVDDCAEVGVKALSLVSDGESTINPAYVHTIQYGASKGLSMASGTNAYLLTEPRLREVMPHLTYLRVNITAGESEAYKRIMGVKEGWFERVCENIRTMRRLKDENGWDCTIGMQMVLMPQYADQIMPLARLGKELRPDYLVIKHCSDDEAGTLGVDYAGYSALENTLHEAEALSDESYKVVVKWSKIKAEGTRSYERCYGAPFLLQISGSGRIAPCGMLFADKYKRFHIANIVTERFRDIVKSDRYWEVMDLLRSPEFNAKTMCGSLCLQHKINEKLDRIVNHGDSLEIGAGNPQHINFI